MESPARSGTLQASFHSDMPFTVSQQTLRTVWFSLVIIGGFFSYSDDQPTLIKLTSYVLTLAGVLLIAATSGAKKSDIVLAISASAGFFLSVFASSLSFITSEQANPNLARALQALIYPIIFLLLLLAGHKLFSCHKKPLIRIVVTLALVNFAVAMAAILGLISALPVFGDIPTARFIFGTQVPSSSGLSLNVNYYSTVQLTLTLLYLVLATQQGTRLRKKQVLLSACLAITMLVGSSRGGVLALLVAYLTVLMIALLAGPKSSRRGALVTLTVLGGASLAVIAFYYERFYAIARLDRGLNARDSIWADGLLLWLDKPLFGWGPGAEQLLGGYGSGLHAGRSLHSGYITALAEGGLLRVFSTFFIILLITVYCLGRNRLTWFHCRWPVATIMAYLASTAFRNFSLGGLGLLPVAALICVSICVFYHKRYRFKPHY